MKKDLKLNNDPYLVFKYYNYNGRLSVKITISKYKEKYNVDKIKVDVDDTLWKVARQNDIEVRLLQLRNHNSEDLGSLVNYLFEEIKKIVKFNE